MPTTTRPWYKPIVVWGANLYWFMSQPILVAPLTYIGCDYLPTVEVVVQVAEAEAVASLCGRTCAFSRHSFR